MSNAHAHRIPQDAIKGSDAWMDWGTAAALWGISAAGNVIAFNGGIDATFRGSYWPQDWSIALWPFAFGVLWQVLLQWRQFANCHDKHSWKYRTALLLSAGPSCVAFMPEIVPWLAGMFPASWWWPLTYGGIALLIIVVIFGIDIIQEDLILDKDG